MTRTLSTLSLIVVWGLATPALASSPVTGISLDAGPAAASVVATDQGAAWARDLPFDETHGTVSEDGRIDTHKAGLAVAGFRDQGAGAKAVRQADVLLSLQGTDGGLPDGAEIRGRSIRPDEGARSLAAQAAAIQGFLAAWEETGDEKYRSAARKSYLFVQRELWAPQAGVYRAHENARSTTYDEALLGTTVGAFRDLAEAHDGEVREEMLARIETLWSGVSAKGDPSAGVTIDTRK